MAVLLTNGTSYIRHNRTGAVIRVPDMEDAQDFHTVERALMQKRKAPSKCAGFYHVDTDDVEAEPHGEAGGTVKRRGFSAKERLAVYRKTEGHCYLCGEFVDFDSFEMEHSIPVSKGGTNNISNLFCACHRCNTIKHDACPEEFMDRVVRIFLYQMQKRNGKRMEWRIARKLLESLDVAGLRGCGEREGLCSDMTEETV